MLPPRRLLLPGLILTSAIIGAAALPAVHGGLASGARSQATPAPALGAAPVHPRQPVAPHDLPFATVGTPQTGPRHEPPPELTPQAPPSAAATPYPYPTTDLAGQGLVLPGAATHAPAPAPAAPTPTSRPSAAPARTATPSP